MEMSARVRLALLALLVLSVFAIVGLAAALHSAVPLFFAWIPAALMIAVERRAGP
jgi:hypothetical protein